MSSNTFIKQFSSAALALFISGGVYSATPPTSGLIVFAPIQLQDAGGAALEQAVITFQNQNYEVTFDGLGVGGVKGAQVIVTGEVLGLNSVADLENEFVTELADAPPTEVSSDDLWLYNQRGVSLHLRTGNPGITLASGNDRVLVHFGPAP